jgi:predicted protein tyrosine phosphatase
MSTGACESDKGFFLHESSCEATLQFAGKHARADLTIHCRDGVSATSEWESTCAGARAGLRRQIRTHAILRVRNTP